MFTPQILLISLAGLYLILHIPHLIYPEKWTKSFRIFFAKPEYARIASFFMFFYAFFFLSVQWRIESGWIILIPILGWLILLKGIIFFWFPEQMGKFIGKIISKSETGGVAMSAAAILIALVLIYLALNMDFGIIVAE